MLVENGITLISTAEDSGSSVSPVEAQAFLAEEAVAVADEVVVAAEEDDDMFGNME